MTPQLPNNDPWSKIRDLEKRIAVLERTPSGPWSIGVDRQRPMVTNGTPTDTIFAGLPEPLPTGIPIWDATARKFRVRAGPNDYPGVALT